MMIPMLLALATLGAAGDPPAVRYAVKVVTKSWEPLELANVERMIEAKALPVLSASGTMRLEKSSYADLKEADYTLVLDGRFIEEAEKLSVYLTFGPGKRTDLPSFHVSDTASLGGLAKDVMQQRIEALAEKAARRLAEVLAPRLEAARLEVAVPIEDQALPWDWGAIEVPRVTSPTKVMKMLLDVRNEDHVRYAALAEIKSQVFDQPAVRDVVSLCLLRDPTPGLRTACAEALGPVSRTHVPTQRLVLHALRSEVDEGVVGTLSELAKSFVGLSRKECLESWLELVSSEGTPSAAAERVARALAVEGDVPNLDLAIAKCLRLEALAYGKRHACAQWLLPKVPEARRRAIVWRYLEELAVWDQGGINVFNEVRDHTFGRGFDPIDPASAELFLAMAERRSAGWVRDDALYVAMRNGKPTPAFMQRILQVATDPELTRAALRALVELTGRSKDLTPMTLGGLEKLRAEGPRLRQKFGSDPNREIAETIKRLERQR